MTDVLKNNSFRYLMHVCTDLIISSGGNIKDFSLFHSTIWRANKKTILEKAAQLKRGVKRAGAAQYDALAKVLEDYGMCGLCYDTTA